MSRVEGLTRKRAGFLTRFLYWMSKRQLGKVVEPLAVSAHNGRVLFGYAMMEVGLQGAKKVDATLKELAQIKVAMLVGCPF
ncbi:MAG: hypothetical protein EP343_28695 [Deltaproteobacteria bacterium]|nr:MAG: hypothetical protein EP343_28695 [Deltaproteobacteria bacterium]